MLCEIIGDPTGRAVSNSLPFMDVIQPLLQILLYANVSLIKEFLGRLKRTHDKLITVSSLTSRWKRRAGFYAFRYETKNYSLFLKSENY